MGGRSGRDQGWIGAVAVAGLLLFAATFLRPSEVINARRARETRTADDAVANTQPVSQVEAGGARALLAKVATTYQRAQTYRDRTVMQLYRRDDPTRLLDTADILVNFERPNRIRLDVQRDRDQLLLVSDGRQMWARIIDPGTNNFDNQLVVKPAPESMTVPTLYELCNYTRLDQPDQRYSALMSLPAPLLVSQLSLLFDPEAMTTLISQAENIDRLVDDTFRGLPSQRVRVTTEGGPFVFWIDPYTAQLQRIEFPTPLSDAGDRRIDGDPRPAASPMMLVAEFRDRRFDQPSNRGSFQLPISSATRPVRRFILPPEDRSADLLGRVVTGYWFTDLYGQQIHDHDWDSQIMVLVWFGNHGASRAVLHETQQAAERYAGDERIGFRAICVEPSTAFSHQQVDELLRSWAIRLPAARDLEAFGRDVFRVQQAPTLVVLDRQSRVQLIEVGGSSALDEQLASVLDRLLAGENLAQRYLDHLQTQREAYERLVAEVMVDAQAFDDPSVR